MATSDGSVVLDVDMNVSDAEKELSRLKGRVFKLEGEIEEKEYSRNVLVQRRRAIEAEITELKKEMKLLDGDAFADNSSAEAKMAELRNQAAGLQKEIEKYDADLDKSNAALDFTKMRYGEILQETERLHNEEKGEAGGIDLSPAEQAKTKIESIMQRIKAVALEGANSLKLGITGIAFEIKNIVEKGLKSAASLVKSGMKNLAALVQRASKSFLSLFKNSGKMNESFVSGIKKMLLYSVGIRSLHALTNKLRTALTDGLKNLAQFSGSTNASISMMKSALTQLKNSIATAFAPILTVVAPLITQFINMISSAANAVARLTAMLTGQKSYAKAISVQEDYAASLEGTASAADEAAGSLAGFDEINAITTENTASGGGAGVGEAAPSEMFEMVEVEPLSFDSWGEAFSAMLSSILDIGIPKLKDGLTFLAGWINSFSANLYEMFTFPGVYDKVVAIGVELANALNDFVNLIDWATLGGALGAGLNLALGFLVSFLYTFDWMNLGANLAEMVNNAVAEIDWENVGKLLWAKFKIALETLAGFILGLDMPEMAQAAGDIVIGFFDSMTETLQNIDWFALGEQVRDFLVNIDWAGVAESVFTAIGSAFGAAAAFLWGLIHEAWDEVVNWWYDVAYEDGQFTLRGLLEGIGDVIKNIGTWLKEHIVDPFVKGFCELFGIHSPSTVMAELGGYIMEGLLNGISSMVGSVVETFFGLWEEIQGVFAHITDWFRDKFSDAWQAVKDVFSTGGEIFDGIKDGILDGLKAVINALIDGINKVITIPFNGINSALKLIKSVDIFGVKPFSWIPTISIPQIPRLAQGAVIPPNREFMAVLGDQTSGNNLEAPESLLRQIQSEGNAEMVQLLQSILSAIKEGQVIMVGETVLGRTTIRAINSVTTSAGKQLLLI